MALAAVSLNSSGILGFSEKLSGLTGFSAGLASVAVPAVAAATGAAGSAANREGAETFSMLSSSLVKATKGELKTSICVLRASVETARFLNSSSTKRRAASRRACSLSCRSKIPRSMVFSLAKAPSDLPAAPVCWSWAVKLEICFL